ncbi:exosortase [Derxia lacustris]|uniref:exosortase n=1 Tax=Derxia lacustris TaxID=764842 RepID=UPI000A171239|nr:exosortase [Derxia lacustris]
MSNTNSNLPKLGDVAPLAKAGASAPFRQFAHGPRRMAICGAVLAACAIALYLPTFILLAGGIWQEDMGSYGPIVLMLSAYLLVSKGAFRPPQSAQIGIAALPVGILLLLLGLAAAAIGHSQQFVALEMAGLPFVVAGMQACMTGLGGLRRAWFGYVLALFAIPWPGSVIDTLTQPMKIAASFGAAHVFDWLGYPVARAGVILTLGPYKLLVADACSGLSSLFALEALGLTYINVVRHESLTRNALLAMLIVPISYVANVTRVVFIGLISFHFGEAAGQGFLHEFSGVVLFLTALLLITSVDNIFRGLRRRWQARAGQVQQ